MSMTSCRSISFAPEQPMADSSIPAEWTICRDRSVFPVPDNETLERWTEQGRVRSDDYLVNHPLDVCVQAREVAELDAIFRKARAHVLTRISRALACCALGLGWVAPLFGTIILMSAIGAAGLVVWTLRHRPSYRVSTTAVSARDSQTRGHARLIAVREA